MRARSEAPASIATGVNAVTNALSDVRRLLDGRPDTPEARALRGRLESYEHIVHAWTRTPPSEPQRAAMMDCLRDLRARVETVADGPDLPLRARTTRPPAPTLAPPPSSVHKPGGRT